MNEQILEHIGKSKTQNLLNEIGSEFFELQKKQFPDVSIAKALSIVSIVEQGEIKKIGMSCIDDLILDNMGLVFTNLFAQQGNFNLVDTAGVTRVVDMFNTSNQGMFDLLGDSVNQVLGTQGQIGTGLTPALRSDFSLESLLGAIVGTGAGGWNSGLGRVTVSYQVSGLVGSGNISETGLNGKWYVDIGAIEKAFLITRDLINPVVPFINGQTANVDYQWNFS